MNTVKQVIVTTSWDDGHPLDSRLARLLDRYGIAGTFYVPFSNRGREVMDACALRELARGFEIGAHTRSHPDLCTLSDETLSEEVWRAKEDLEDVLSREVTMFCYPFGRHDKRVRSTVAGAGFVGARTIREFHLVPGVEPMQMCTTLLAFPLPIHERARHELLTRNWVGIKRLGQVASAKRWGDVAVALFEEVLAKGGVWHLWGHSWQIEENALWQDLEALLANIAHREGVRYLINGQVAREAYCPTQGSSS